MAGGVRLCCFFLYLGALFLDNQTSSDAKREYVIKIIPDQGETMHSIRLPMHLVKYAAFSCAAAAVLFVGSFGYSVYSGLNSFSDQQELRDLRTVNAAQQEQLSSLAKKANDLQDEMEKVNEIERELRQLAGADPVAAETQDASAQPSEEAAQDALGQPVDQAPQNAPAQMPAEGQGFDGQGGPWIEPNVRHVNNALDNIRQRLAMSRENLERVREALHEQQRAIGYQNQLSAYLPSLWPASGDVSSPYGLRWGGSDFHPGIDIANDYGTPIVAAASGTVTAAGWNSGGYGNMVDIDHGNGIWTRYGHAEAVAVSVGETVRKGQIIAYMGSTGFSTGPHVHYEVHVNGEIVNPILYLGGE